MRRQDIPYMKRTRLYYEAQGFKTAYSWANFPDVPFTPLVKPLSKSTLTVITTAALYERESTDPRNVASASTRDPIIKLFANDLAWDKETTHLDDLNSYFPIIHLRNLVKTGRIGTLTEQFFCLPTEYSQRRTMEHDAPEILARCRDTATDVALFVPL